MISFCSRSLIFVIKRYLFILTFIIAVSSISLCSSATPGHLNENALSNEEKSGDQIVQNLNVTSIRHPVHRRLVITIQSLPRDIRIIVASYLDNPVTTLGSIDKSYFDLFRKEYNLKYYLVKSFNIPEFCNVNENEPEIAGILSLSWCRNDPFILLASILEGISSGKKPYKELFRPLISYVDRIYNNEFNTDTKKRYGDYLMNKYLFRYPIHLGKICAKNGHFDLVSEFLNEGHLFTMGIFSDVESRKDLMDFFKANPNLAIKLQANLMRFESVKYYLIDLNRVMNIFKWIGECIVYDAPEEYYTDLIVYKPVLFMNLISSDWLLSLNIPESEYPRIYSQIRKLVDVHLSRVLCESDFYFSNLINDIRFGSIDLEQVNLSTFDERRLVIIGKTALFGNKIAIFHEIIYKYNIFNVLILSIIRIVEENGSSLQENCLRVVFELITANTERCFESDKNIPLIMKFVMKFYALKHLTIVDQSDEIYFEFVALKDSALPPNLIMKRNLSDIFINNEIFSYMKVVDVESFSSLLSDYVKCPKIEGSMPISIEVMELLANEPNLIDLSMALGLNFSLKFDKFGSFKDLKKYLNLPNFDRTSFMVQPVGFPAIKVTEFQTRNHLEKIEKLEMKTVDEYYLEYERLKGSKFTGCEYFQWRIVFSHWIKGDKKERIKEITSLDIIQMLTLEFPDEMKAALRL